MGRRWGVFLALLAGIALGVFSYRLVQPRSQRVLAAESQKTPLPVRSAAHSDMGSGLIADAAARIAPSVVTINTEYRPRALYGRGDFFGLGRNPMVVPRGAGSGVIIDADGTIVTNNHVVQNAARIHVRLNDGRELEGRVIGSDAQTDIAIVKVDAKDLPAAKLGDAEKVRVGEWVVAVGNPLDVGMTVTAGIVSAIRKQEDGPGRNMPLQSAIQTDAAINPGNSGGALADIEGQLIGINTVIASTTGGNIGIGFAIPIDLVREIAQQLKENGRVIRPWLGITFGPITDQARRMLNLPADLQGTIVGEVLPGSPAAEAGLRPGDVLVHANDTVVKEPQSLEQTVQNLKVGDKLQLHVWRQGEERTLSATLKERPRFPVQS